MSLLAFNWIGYRVVSGFLEHSSDNALESKIENQQYDENSLFEIRVPLNAPYLAGTSTGFERIDGEIEVQGVHYKYVKRKVEHGELVLLCIPNEAKTKIQNSRVDFFKLVNDLNSTKEKSKSASSTKNFTAEYREQNNNWIINAIKPVSPVAGSLMVTSINDGFHIIPDQPPQA